MWKNINIEKCFSYINSQAARPIQERLALRPCITISRMCGAGGRTVASRLAEYLQSRVPVACNWTVFDRNLIGKVLQDHQLSQRIAQYLPENRKPLIEDIVEDLLGLHPPMSILIKQTSETILNLAEKGFVILVGRGANVVTSRLEAAFHVRLVSPVNDRIRRLIEVYDFDYFNACDFLKAQDAAKKRYLKDYFGKDIDDPQLYHLIINTGGITYENTARLIGDAVIHRFNLVDEAEANAV